MKKIICILLVAIISLFVSGCNIKTETGRKAMDCRYTAPYSEVVTDYQHKYSVLKGEFVLVPNIHTVTRPARYEILYLVSYDDGTTAEQWKEVDEATYISFKRGAE
jgi:hypothetical protein